jgi:hypothetical protein
MRMRRILSRIRQDMVKRQARSKVKRHPGNGCAAEKVPRPAYFAGAGARAGSTLVGRRIVNEASSTE